MPKNDAMLVHLRLTVPPDLTDHLLPRLRGHEFATNVVAQYGAVVDPLGDLIELDTPRESASSIIDELEAVELSSRGAIVLIDVDAAPFDRAGDLADRAHGSSDDAVIWDMVLEQVQSGADFLWSYFAFLTIATGLAAVAVITDSPILVVGAMVVSPDFSPVAAIATGVAFGRWKLARGGIVQMVLGYTAAVAVIAALALVAHLVGVLPRGEVTGARPLTAFIWQPNLWSFVVAVLAGAAGSIALTASKTTTLVGVFISITTVPAAGNLAVALAVHVPAQIVGSLAQLGVNVAGMLLAGVAVLVFQRQVVHPPRDLVRNRRRL